MSGAFDWLNRLISSFGQLFPRIRLVRKTYVCVFFRYNGTVVVKQPGIVFYWPMLTDIRLIPVTVRSWSATGVIVASDEIEGRFLTLPVAIMVGAVIMGRVVDAAKMIDVYNIRRYVTNVLVHALCEQHQSENDPEYPERVRLAIVDKLAAVGIEVHDFAVVGYHRRLATGDFYSDDNADHCSGDSDAV